MNDQYPRRPDGPWTEGQRRPDGPWTEGQHQPGPPAHLEPTEQFPTPQYPDAQHPTTRFPGTPHPGLPHPHAPAPGPAYPRPAEPLAHEGGYPYGMPPAAPYAHPEPYIPQHLHVPPQPFPHGPYPPPYAYPQPMQQQTVVVHGNGKRVSHGLHLLLTLITAGLWLPVWIILAIANS